MDLIKTLLVYMMMVVSAATEASPGLTPPPADMLPTATPYVSQAPIYSPVPTETPTATPAPYTTLYAGDRGEDVKKLQRRLTELGYLNDTIDGIYGQNTKKAVERFQYYNNLKVDGVAGKATQTLLFESTAVVTAPPSITQGPTMQPVATAPASVTVPVYYVNEDGQLLRQVDMICYGTTTIYANGNYVGGDYILISSNAVTVAVQNGKVTPASVTFRYQKRVTPAPTVSTVVVPVYYTTEDGVMFYQTSATLNRGVTSHIAVDQSVVPPDYELIGEASASVTVTAQGAATPSTVIFRFQYNAPTEAPTAVPTEVPATEAPTAVPTEVPATEVPTAVPTEVPATEVPTAVPTEVPATEVPTAVPTEVPATEVPTAVPTEVPATEAPTAVPTEVPVTEAPTAVPTEVPVTEAPTAVPTEVPSGLTISGNILKWNGTEHSFAWYRDEQQQPMLSLKALATLVGLDYAPGSPCVVWGHEILAAYDGGGISTLTIDGQSHLDNARIWEGDLYVNFAFLQALGADAGTSGDALSILSPQ